MGRGPDVARTLTVAVPFALVLPFAALAASASGALSSSPRWSIAATFAVLVTALLVGLVLATRTRLPRAGAAASAVALAVAPAIALSAHSSLDKPIVWGPPEHVGCGTGLMSLLALLAPVGLGVLFFAGLGLGIAFARRRSDGLLRIASAGGVVLALLAFGMAAVRVTRPDPDTYLATLTTAGALAVGETKTILGRDVRYEVAELPPTRPWPDESPPQPNQECRVTGLGEAISVGGFGPCPEVRFRVSPAGDFAVLETRWADPPGAFTPVRAFRLPGVEQAPITIADVKSQIAPPVGWTIGAGLGGGLGALLLLAARGARRRARSLAGVDATHRGDGWVDLADGETIRVPAAAELPIGPVVLGDATERAPTYRETGTPTFAAARKGTLEELRGASTDLAASLEGVALAAASLGAAPLVVARFFGLF